MNKDLECTLTAIHADPTRPHKTSPVYEHWLAEQVWNAAIKAEWQRFYEDLSPCAKKELQMAASLLDGDVITAAGVACCEQNDQGGPGPSRNYPNPIGGVV